MDKSGKLQKEDVASYLLNEGFELTALEFYQELQENGLDLPSLRKHFAPDSKELQEFQQQQPPNPDAILKDREDKISTLEFELKVSKETIQSLREQLSKAVSKGKRLPPPEKKKTSDAEEMENESRALNFLIRKYLIQQGYKLTAITMEEEIADQELSDWNDVGLSTSEPPSLATFYRHFYKFGPNKDNHAMAEQKRLQKKVTELEEKNEKLLEQKLALEEKIKALQAAQPPTPETSTTPSATEATTPTATPSAAQQTEPASKDEPASSSTAHTNSNSNSGNNNRYVIRRTFAEIANEEADTREEDSESFVRITRQLFNISKLDTVDATTIVKIIGDCLPHIVKGVILKKREEMIPVILCVISQHPESKVRYQLTQLLFNLIKKPNEYDRKMIVDGLVALANITSEERIETELLAQCWDEISNKRPERRALIAFACGALAPFVRPELRTSLIPSILQQLAEDKHATVREAVSRNLGVLISLFTTDEKFNQIEELVYRLLYDEDHTVRLTTQHILLPVFAEWADSLSLLCSRVFTKLLREIDAVVSKPDYLEKKNAIAEHDVQRIVLLFQSFRMLLPRYRHIILLTSPFAPVILGNQHFTQLTEQQEKQLQAKLDEFIKAEDTANLGNGVWSEFSWLVKTGLDTIISIIAKTTTNNSSLIQAFTVTISELCTLFGNVFAAMIIKSKFQQYLEKDQQTQTRVLPIYLVGVLANLKDKGLMLHLKELILKISLEESGYTRGQIQVLQDSVRMICKLPQRRGEVLDLLWELVVHPAFHVRACIVSIFNGLVNIMTSEELSKRVLPAFVTLGGDPEKLVRSASIQAFATVAISFNEDSAILEKVGMQLNSYLEDDQHATRVEVTKVFSTIIPQVNAMFRDHVILPKLVEIADKNDKQTNNSERDQLVRLLFEAFRAYSSCLIDNDSIEKYILPGLQILKKDAEHIEGQFKNSIQQLITDMEGAVKKEDDNKSTPSKSKAFFDKMKPSTPSFFNKKQ